MPGQTNVQPTLVRQFRSLSPDAHRAFRETDLVYGRHPLSVTVPSANSSDVQAGAGPREARREQPGIRFKDALEKNFAEVNYDGWRSANPPTEAELTRRWQDMRPHCLVKVCLQGPLDAPNRMNVKATCTAVLEPCIDGSVVVHGENMVTAKDMRRVGVARQLISSLFEELPAYKISHVLCSSLQPMTQKLYREFGLRSAGIQMEHRLNSSAGELEKRKQLPPLVNMRRLEAADGSKGLSRVMSQAKEGFVQDSLDEAQIERYLTLSEGIKETFVITQVPPSDPLRMLPGLKLNVDRERILGVGHLFIEHKLIEGEGRPTAHISDLVIDKDFRGWKLGQALFAQLVERAKFHNAWRILMQAEAGDLPFLKKQGARELSLQLAKPVSEASQAYFDQNKAELEKSTPYLNAAYFGLWVLEKIFSGYNAVRNCFCPITSRFTPG